MFHILVFLAADFFTVAFFAVAPDFDFVAFAGDFLVTPGAAGWWIAEYMGDATGATVGFGFGTALSITILILVVGFVSFDWKSLGLDPTGLDN